MSINKVILLGRLGADPELKYTQNQKPVANFSIATSEKWADKEGVQKEKTEWHRIIVWGKVAEHCKQYLKKGSQVYIEGSLVTRSWDEGDLKKYITEINSSRIVFLDEAPQKTEPQNKDTSPSQPSFAQDDVPF